MHVIRHNHVSAYDPAMTLMRGAPFLNQNLSDLVPRQTARRSFVHMVMK
jgi:hypothetical protein